MPGNAELGPSPPGGEREPFKHPPLEKVSDPSFLLDKEEHGGVEAHQGQKQGQMTRLSTQGANVGKIHRRIKGARTVT